MAVSTGDAPLLDIGKLAYNGVQFSMLFHTSMHGEDMQDNAGRTIKWVKYLLTADGVVTLSAGQATIDDTMVQLRKLLQQDAGQLDYQGRGLGAVTINPVGGDPNQGSFDLQWGPKPKILHFQPLGQGRSAMVQWQVEFCIPEIVPSSTRTISTFAGGAAFTPVVQFNEETAVRYDEDGFSHLTIKGTLEIPLTRPQATIRTMTTTVDDFRAQFLDNIRGILENVNLTKFRVTDRSFNVSRDKRVMEWSFVLDELPYMAPPMYCTNARGEFTFRPVKNVLGIGAVQWYCSLQCTYTVMMGQPRRVAWWAFLLMLKARMEMSKLGVAVDALDRQAAAQQVGGPRANALTTPLSLGGGGITSDANALYSGANQGNEQAMARLQSNQSKALLWSFEAREGMYLDSRTTTFGATWVVICNFPTIIKASGLWVVPPLKVGSKDTIPSANTLWAQSVFSIMGSQSWLPNRLDPTADVIVDFGGP